MSFEPSGHVTWVSGGGGAGAAGYNLLLYNTGEKFFSWLIR